MPQILGAVIGLALLTPSAGAPTADAARATFEKGLRLFHDAQTFQRDTPVQRREAVRRFHAAAECLEGLYRDGVISTELLTNIANAYYFAGDIGRAVLFYRRALLADPGNRVARDSLSAVRAGLPICEPAAGPAANLVQAMLFWHQGTSFRTRRLVFLLAFPCVWVFLALALWRRKPFRLLGILAAVIAVPLAGSLAADVAGRAIDREAVILTETVGRRGDHASYSESHSRPFPPGTEVTILDERTHNGRTWLSARLLDGTDTWIPADRIERVAD